MKQFLQTLGVVGVIALMGASTAFADAVGTIDIDKVINNYNKAQGVMADMKVREADLRKLQADYIKQLEDSRKNQPKNPVATDQLEKDLTGKLNTKMAEYRDWTAARQKEIDTDLDTTIHGVAQSKHLDVVLSKQAVLEGGTDITNDVLSRLNATK